MTQKRIKVIISYLLCVAMLCACGKKEKEVASIELLDPVTAVTNTEKAAKRDLFEYKVYSGFVLPYVEEYSFSVDVTMRTYNASYGQKVKKGDALITADADKLEESIKNLQDTMDELLENYEERIESYNERRQEIEDEMAWPLEVQALQQGIENPPLSRQIDLYYKQLEKIDLQKKQAKESYDLEKKRYDDQMKQLQAEKKEQVLIAQIDGTIVACNFYRGGDRISEGDSVVAVGNDSQKLFRCNYMSAKTIAAMQDIYAIINGKRYEVTYLPYENSEYNRLEARGESVYSIFEIQDENNEVEIGDFMEIILIKKEVDEAISIPKAAIHKDEKSSFVYVVKDGITSRKDIIIGFSDGTYTEILEGVQEKDEVLLNDYITFGKDVYTIEKGNFGTSYEGGVYAEYQQFDIVRNPIKHGTVHLVEFVGEYYQLVQKGDVIAKVRVERDEVATIQQQKELQRLTERLADLEADTDHLKENAKSIQTKKEQIAKLEDEIAEAERDYATTEITSEYYGLLAERPYFEEDEIIGYEYGLAAIVSADDVILKMENEGGILSLNDDVKIEYTNNSSETAYTTGRVVSVSPVALSSKFTDTKAIVKINEEALGDIMFVGDVSSNNWGRLRLNITATARTMDNVLLVPVKAVFNKDGQTYVYVIDDNGNITARSFIAGGYDKEYYWVAQGLEEGMKLCSK